MIGKQRRVALLTGASLTALGLATPAFAAPHDAFIPGGTVQSGTSTSFSPLTICTINATCFHGVVDTGVANATANVVNTATGRIIQNDNAATVDLVINNPLGDFGEVGAIAIASNPAGAASASATIFSYAISQSAVATTGSAAVALNNGGTLLIDAVASAHGATGADASASISSAINQFASVTAGATGNAVASINNDGTLSVLASAHAVADTGFASADASINTGISQTASNNGSGNASVAINNDGTLNIHVVAFASGDTASASASNSDAIDQFAFAADGDASVAINNSVAGVLDITAGAVAIANNGNANATASVDSAFDMFASATNGNANATMNNDGAVNVTAFAGAAASGLAQAYATVDSAIEISASADDVGNLASAALNNNGTINIHATAQAIGSTARAFASVDTGINVNADGDSGADALAVVDNNAGGVIDISANAAAIGFTATAVATVDTGINNSASASSGGNATASILNDGSISIAANASASAFFAQASASVVDGISQTAGATSGSALALINNGTAGTIDIGANAVAGGVNATAYATVDIGIYQSASASVSGNATASIVNDGGISVHATANASASDFAKASAFVSSAISQIAHADSGNASINFSGAGTVDIGAVAKAISTTSSANAYASVSYGLYQVAEVANSGDASINDTLNGFNLHATASALGSDVSATAFVFDGIGAHADNNGTGNASVNITNAAALTIAAVANATSTRNDAQAYATVSYGISMTAEASSGDATVTFVNNGTVDIAANAHAVGNTFAGAFALVEPGIYQSASANGGGDASVSLINAPALTIEANATATGNSATAIASVTAGVSQNAFAFGGGDAAVLVSNADPFVISAHALANGNVNFATASASVDTGIFQFASATLGNAAAAVINSGTMSIAGSATANGGTFAYASGFVGQGIAQTAVAGSGVASVVVDNQNVLNIEAAAHAVATSFATASARVNTGIAQSASGTAGSLALINNDGTLDVGAVASATANFGASASATAYGVSQTAVLGTASFINGTAGLYNVHATANASAPSGFASANAYAYGAFNVAALNVLDNAGVYNVVANAAATGSSGSASASVIGYGAYGTFGGTTAAFDIVNETGATFNASAHAAAPSGAQAYAIGISVGQYGPSSAVATHEEAITGSITNNGTLNVVASAAGGGTFTTPTVGGGVTTVVQSTASATGIYMASGSNNMTVTNTGTLSVDAITAGNGNTSATGILAVDNGDGIAAPAGSLLTIVNDGGDIIVRESLDGGATWRRGMAIDVALAPNPTVINLLGDGNIYGNIDDATTDAINVESGTTYFDGIINPEYVPAGGFTEADLDSGLFGDGSLTISNDGNLILADPRLTGDPTMYDGPAYAIVETFTVATDGTITFELQPATGGTQPVGTYPQVFADVANLDGTLVADFTPAGGLFFDNYFYDNVIDANVRNGGFDGAKCVLGGAYGGSLLLDLDCVEDANDNIDLALTRVPFDQVPGLNQNGTSVGSGLECIYDPTLTGGIADLLGDLFLFTDPVNYNTALNQLAGEGYANYLQSFPSLGVHYNDLIDHATNCEVPALAGSILECRASAPLHLWGQLDYQWRKADGDSEAGTMKARRFTGLIGLDANVGNAAIIGGSIGYVTNNTRTRRFSEKVDGDGFQVGLYGAYDPGLFYVKAIGTYSWYNGDSSRRINFAGLATGATFAANPQGDPDANMWTFGLHGGYRIGMGGNSVVTPYVNYDYVNAKLKSFTESGGNGAELTVLGGRSKHSFLTGGVKWATQVGGVVPEVNLGYRYRFGKKYSSFSAAFLGDESCDFDVISASQKKGTFLAGLSVGGKMGPVDLRIGYEGEFNNDITSHSANFKIVIPLGGHAAPPPPPPAPVVEAPPPPPAPEPAPPPPPPPPAPVERGERGQ